MRMSRGTNSFRIIGRFIDGLQIFILKMAVAELVTADRAVKKIVHMEIYNQRTGTKLWTLTIGDVKPHSFQEMRPTFKIRAREQRQLHLNIFLYFCERLVDMQ